jgi:hypothetical protein
MNTDVMESVLHEILNEQKEPLKLNKQLVSKMEYLSVKIENLEKDGDNHQRLPSIEDTKVLTVITEGIENIKQVIAAQQKNGSI